MVESEHFLAYLTFGLHPIYRETIGNESRRFNLDILHFCLFLTPRRRRGGGGAGRDAASRCRNSETSAVDVLNAKV